MSNIERETETTATTPFVKRYEFEPEPGQKGPGIDELVAAGEIDEPIPGAQFEALASLVSTLKKRRESKGLSLADISEKSGLTRASISRLEGGWNNNPTLETVFRYGLALDVAVTFGFDEIEPEEA
jgi:DNA-binding XRE family transcriptional regulator